MAGKHAARPGASATHAVNPARRRAIVAGAVVALAPRAAQATTCYPVTAGNETLIHVCVP